jgi:hypothetical protein
MFWPPGTKLEAPSSSAAVDVMVVGGADGWPGVRSPAIHRVYGAVCLRAARVSLRGV